MPAAGAASGFRGKAAAPRRRKRWQRRSCGHLSKSAGRSRKRRLRRLLRTRAAARAGADNDYDGARRHSIPCLPSPRPPRRRDAQRVTHQPQAPARAGASASRMARPPSVLRRMARRRADRRPLRVRAARDGRARALPPLPPGGRPPRAPLSPRRRGGRRGAVPAPRAVAPLPRAPKDAGRAPSSGCLPAALRHRPAAPPPRCAASSPRVPGSTRGSPPRGRWPPPSPPSPPEARGRGRRARARNPRRRGGSRRSSRTRRARRASPARSSCNCPPRA